MRDDAMCRSCRGSFPTISEHRVLSDRAKSLRDDVTTRHLKADAPEFLNEIRRLDQIRFGASTDESSPEWGHPETAPSTRRLIFSSNKTHTLTLFVLTCWYDAQEPYTTVWSRRMAQLAEWLSRQDKSISNLPSSRTAQWARPSAWATWQHCADGGFSKWFSKTVNEIARGNPTGGGNLWRFTGRLALDLTKPGRDTRKALERLASGVYATVDYKRAWMLTMFLRRDQGIIRCLVERSLSSADRGEEAARLWYDDSVFPERECQLPVDSRMAAIGQELFGPSSTKNKAAINEAHAWGERHGLSPSILDVLFFSMD